MPYIDVVSVPTPTDFAYSVLYSAAMLTAETAGVIKEAALKIAVELYEQRSVSVTGTISTNLKLGLQELLNPYRSKLWL
jgi:hypothetical protein